MNYLDEQMICAKDNYNYFFMKLLFGILKVIIYLSIVLLISIIFNYLFINIIALIYTIYSMYAIYSVIKYYTDIINDIKNTLGYNYYSFEIDFSLINKNIFKGIVKYGK